MGRESSKARPPQRSHRVAMAEGAPQATQRNGSVILGCLSQPRGAGNRSPGHNKAAMQGGDHTLAGVRTTEPDALTRLARQACGLAGAEAAALDVRDGDDPRSLRVAAAWGGKHEQGSTVGVDEGLPGRVMTSGEAADGAVPVLCDGTLSGFPLVDGPRRADAATLEDLAAVAGELVARED